MDKRQKGSGARRGHGAQYRKQVATLATGARVPDPNGEFQLHDGSTALRTQNGLSVGSVQTSYTNTGSLRWTEVWQVTDWSHFASDGKALRLVHQGDGDYLPMSMGPKLATMRFDYVEPPNASKVSALGPAPVNWTSRHFSVRNKRDSTWEQTGALYREIQPGTPPVWTDHWVLTDRYTPPRGQAVVELLPTASGPPNLKAFLQDMLGTGDHTGWRYVQVSYSFE